MRSNFCSMAIRLQILCEGFDAPRCRGLSGRRERNPGFSYFAARGNKKRCQSQEWHRRRSCARPTPADHDAVLLPVQSRGAKTRLGAPNPRHPSPIFLQILKQATTSKHTAAKKNASVEDEKSSTLCQRGSSSLGDLILHCPVRQRLRLHEARFHRPRNQAVIKQRRARPGSVR